MFREYLTKLCNELDISSIPKENVDKTYMLRLGKDVIEMRDLEPGLGLHSTIKPCPEKKKEELYIYVSRANLLGQGTGGARIGIDENEKFLTLSLGLPYEINYQMFKETIEDFVNYLIFWQSELTTFENDKSVY